jgi:hypothetical protein
MEQNYKLTDDEDIELDEAAIAELLRLNAAVVGIVLGLLGGISVFLATNLLVIKGGEVVGPHLSLLGQFFIGYEVTFWGSIVGFIDAFVFGFVVGFFLAWSYNLIVDFRARRETAALARARAAARSPQVSLRATDTGRTLG